MFMRCIDAALRLSTVLALCGLLTLTACGQKPGIPQQQTVTAFTPKEDVQIREETQKVKKRLDAHYRIRRIGKSYLIDVPAPLRMRLPLKGGSFAALRRVMLGGKAYFFAGEEIGREAFFPDFMGADYFFAVDPKDHLLQVSIPGVGTGNFTSNFFGNLAPVMVAPKQLFSQPIETIQKEYRKQQNTETH